MMAGVPPPETSSLPTVSRVLDRRALVGLVLNSIIGSGVFVLPGTIGGKLGWSAVWAWIVAAVLIAFCVAAFAEVSSRFDGAGGPYRYAQAAFGSLIGIEVAWLTYMARTVSAATQANLFTTALAEFFPWSASRTGHVVLATAFVGGLALVNLRATRAGAGTSSLLAIVKVGALAILAIGGIWWLSTGRAVPAVEPTDASMSGWWSAMLLLSFAYGGFEGAMIPLGEARNPRRDAPYALIVGFALVVLVYVAVQVAVLATVADPDATQRPLAAAARTLAGAGGAAVATALVVISVVGWMAAAMLNVPRLTVAMAEDGMLPGALARIHPAFGTPVVSIVLFAVLAWILSLSGTLLQNVSLSVVARLTVYVAVCAAMLRFRRMDRTTTRPAGVHAALRPVPGGAVAGMIGAICVTVVLAQSQRRELIALATVMGMAALHWWRVRRQA
jgi:basic amino acid/polyamine antiporter, APA family